MQDCQLCSAVPKKDCNAHLKCVHTSELRAGFVATTETRTNVGIVWYSDEDYFILRRGLHHAQIEIILNLSGFKMGLYRIQTRVKFSNQILIKKFLKWRIFCTLTRMFSFKIGALQNLDVRSSLPRRFGMGTIICTRLFFNYSTLIAPSEYCEKPISKLSLCASGKLFINMP